VIRTTKVQTGLQRSVLTATSTMFQIGLWWSILTSYVQRLELIGIKLTEYNLKWLTFNMQIFKTLLKGFQNVGF
jgi:hypothetical protein